MFLKSIDNRQRAKETKNENEALKKQFQELLDILNKVTNVTEELKLRIELLINQREQIPAEIISELVLILSLINSGHYETAVGHLAKIIENQLKLKHTSSLDQMTKKRLTFHDYVEWARDRKILSKEEIHFTFALKEIRNQAFHQLDVNKDPLLNASSIMIGIGIILKLNEKPKGLLKLGQYTNHTK